MNDLFKLQIPYPLPKLKRLPLREQPAYRMTRNPDACNLTELLAVLVGGSKQIEIAEALLERFESIRKLHQAHATEIASIKGIGQGTALRLKAALELGKRAILETEDERPIIHSPADAAALVQYEMSLLEQEYLKVMLLDTRNRVIDIVEIYHGSVNSSQVRVAELFKPAIQRIAASIIALHNHPSGEVNPSPDDVAVTRAIVQAGNLLDIPLLDHIIIGNNGRYVSLKERGLGFDGGISEAGRRYGLREAEVIYVYTRAQALADGVLIDVSQMAKEAGFRYPTAITADLQAALTPNRRERSYGQSYEGRSWDVLFMACLAARRAIWDSQTAFSVSQAICPGERGRLRRRSLNLWLVVGPGDEHEPVITIGFPEDF
jgi:DNA repair protein RadC